VLTHSCDVVVTVAPDRDPVVTARALVKVFGVVDCIFPSALFDSTVTVYPSGSLHLTEPAVELLPVAGELVEARWSR